MMYEWVNAADTHASPASANNTTDENFTGTPSNVNAGNMVYTNDVEEGWRADGWYEIDGAKSTGKQDDTSWYYFKDGKAKKAPIKVNTVDQKITADGDQVSIYRDRIKIKASKNSYFCFDEVGQMKTGLQAIGKGDNVDFYYFDDNGYMKTGKTGEVENDDSTYYYSFSNKNGDNGQGVTSITDGYLYWNGKRLEADDDYRIYELAPNDYYLVDTKGKIQKSESKEYDVENWNGAGTQENIKFKFNGSKVAQYSVKTANDTFPGYTSISSVMGGNNSTATTPFIKLYDRTYTMTGANGAGTWQ